MSVFLPIHPKGTDQPDRRGRWVLFGLMVLGILSLSTNAAAQVLPGGPPVPDAVIEVTPIGPASVTPGTGASNGDDHGLLDAANGGLGMDLWFATTPARALELLSGLRNPGSPTAADLQRRLVLTAARPGLPGGGDPAGTVDREGQSDFLYQRVQILAEMGDADAASRLLEPFATVATSQRTFAWYDLALWAGHTDKVCDRIGPTKAALPNEIVFQKTAIFCQAIKGSGAEAVLATDLLAEQGLNDPAFAALIAKIAEPDSPAPRTDGLKPTGLHAALLRAAQLPLPPEWSANADWLPLVAYARDQRTDPELRRDAAENLAGRGALPVADLAALYQAIAAKTGDKVIETNPALDDIGAVRAALYVRATKAKTPSARALTITDGLRAARSSGLGLTALRLYAPLMAQIKPGAETWALALDAGRSLSLTGQSQITWSWRNYAEAQGATRPDALAVWQRLGLMARIVGDPTAAPETPVLPSDIANPALIMAVFDGVQTPSATPLLPGGDTPSLMRALESAAQSGKRGEVVALSLTALAGESPGQANPAQLRTILSALSRVGLEREARALGLEAAIEAGL